MRIQSRNIIALFIVICSSTIWLVGSVFEDRLFIWLAVLGIQIAIGIYSCLKISYRCALLFFDITTFKFNTGSFIINAILKREISLWSINYSVDWSMEFKANSIYLLALCFCWLGYHLVETKLIAEDYKEFVEIKLPSGNSMQKASLVVYYCSLIFFVISEIEKVLFVRSYSYLAYYNTFSGYLPGFIYRIANLTFPAFCVYLATMPNKKSAKLPVLLYLIVNTMDLFSGQRNGFVLAILFVLFYYIFRNSVCDGMEEEWFKKKYWIRLFVLVPIGISGLTAYGYWRNGLKSEYGFIDGIISFFGDDASGYLLIHLFHYMPSIPLQSYVFGPVIYFFTNNIVSKALGLSTSYAANSVDLAMKGNSFGSTISYIVMPYSYKAGHGLGSNYLAEAFCDYSWFGVITISFLYGIILATVIKKLKHNVGSNVFITAGLLMILQAIWYAPRSEAMGWLTNSFLSFSTLLCFCLILLVKTIIVRRYTIR